MRYYPVYTISESTKRATTYPDGQSIPDRLPERYGIAQQCGNCAAYDLKTTICATYNAVVRTNYWCATWKAIA